MICVFFLFYFLLLAEAQWSYEEETGNNMCTTPDKKSGTCIQIYNCKPLLNFLQQISKPITNELQEYLKSYSCGFDGRIPKVCCPLGPIYPQEETGIYPDVSKHKNLNMLPKNCGYLDTDNKIVNGDKAGLFEFPWMALLSYKTQFGPQFKCGGTIINNRYILTAAHCLGNLKNPLLGVRVGEYNTKTAVDCEKNSWEGEICAPPFQDLKIENIIIHPDFDRRDFTNDIGLLRVTPINFLENCRPVCLPLAENRNYNFTNRNAIVTGWGITEKRIPSSELLKVSLPVVPQDECNQLYVNIAKIDHRQLCAGGRDNKDSCAGDSGGPLHAIGRIFGDTKLIQQGIVSFGPSNCGGVRIPGVYTRVAAFMDWILNNMEP